MKNIKITELRHRSTHQHFRRVFLARSNGSMDNKIGSNTDKEKKTASTETPASSVKNFENCF